MQKASETSQPTQNGSNHLKNSYYKQHEIINPQSLNLLPRIGTFFWILFLREV